MPSPALTQEAALRQRLLLTPLQIQEIRILEYPTLELEQRVEREIEENPGLEVNDDKLHDADSEQDNQEEDVLQNDDFDLNDYISDDETPDYKLRTNNQSPDQRQEEIPFSVGESFQELMLSQLGTLKLSPEDRQIAQYIIGNIDDDGYLRRQPESLVDDLVFHANLQVSDEKMWELVHLIQNTFEPAGVCAQDLQECLLLQLNRKTETPSVKFAKEIISKRYKDFAAHHYNKILERYPDITQDELKEAIAEIQKLNPRPGNTYNTDVYASTIIVPDFIIDVDNGNITVSLNNANLPELRVNKEFNEILQTYQAQPTHTKQEKEAIAFIKDRIDSARWFIDAIKQRNETLLRTMNAIVTMQRDYFLEGDETLLKPMILKDIAQMTGYDVSTISRVGNSKYAQTPYGIYPLKHFFSESLTNDEGEEVATRAIKNALQTLIAGEDKHNPYNDDEIVVELQKQGYNLARRTVAKYRKILHIPVARLRRTV